jgi:hypothetical protein
MLIVPDYFILSTPSIPVTCNFENFVLKFQHGENMCCWLHINYLLRNNKFKLNVRLIKKALS